MPFQCTRHFRGIVPGPTRRVRLAEVDGQWVIGAHYDRDGIDMGRHQVGCWGKSRDRADGMLLCRVPMTPDESTWLGHPRGLFVLFFTEMWERFSFYGMRAILVLYMTAERAPTALGGLGWTDAEALSLYGTYTMMVYVMSIPGGLAADRYLGQRRAVMVGGLLLCVGHGVLALPGLLSFYAGLGLIVLGVGLLKPNISTMVGSLYPEGDSRRDRGFTIFYIGINTGAFMASIIVGWVGETQGWHYGFGLAGLGMAVGQLVYLWGQRYLRVVDAVNASANTGEERRASEALSPVERDRVKVLLLSFLIVVVFWGAFEQAGGLMSLYTKDKIDRVIGGVEVPASMFQGLNSFFIILCGSLVAGFWARRHRRGHPSSSLFKMAIGTIIMGLGFVWMVLASVQADARGSAALIWIVLAYFFHTIGELCLSPVALSFITKLAPARYASLMMGVYFAVSGIGNKVAGLLGEGAQQVGELVVFTGITAMCVVAGVLILLFLRRLNALTHGADAEAPTA